MIAVGKRTLIMESNGKTKPSAVLFCRDEIYPNVLDYCKIMHQRLPDIIARPICIVRVKSLKTGVPADV